MYDRNCTSQTIWFDHARIGCLVFEPNPLKAYHSIMAILAAPFEEEALEAQFWEQSTIPSHWNLYWTDSAREGEGLNINGPAFRQHWTRYLGTHSFVLYDREGPCDCEESHCTRTHSTVAHAAAAAKIHTFVEILQIVVVPLTPTPSEIEA